MGVCWSCLGRGRRESTHPTTEADETQPLLFHSPSLNGDAAPGGSTVKHQEELGQIVQTTHDHFIDITTISQPDLEHPHESTEHILQRLAELDPSQVWKWPEVRALTADETAALDSAFPPRRLDSPNNALHIQDRDGK